LLITVAIAHCHRVGSDNPLADGVEPEVIAAIHHAAKHVPEVLEEA